MEEWRVIDIPFNRYSVSNFGNVRNDKTNCILRASTCGKYPQVLLFSSFGRKSFYVHILVAQQFLDFGSEKQSNNKIVVHHKDDNKNNYCLDNLEIITSKENARASLKNRKLTNEKRQKKIIQFDLGGKIVKIYDSKNMAIKDYGPSVSACAIGRQKTAYGFIWEYQLIDDLEGEEWKILQINGDNITISNLGRIHNKLGNKGFGSINNGYMVTKVKAKQFFIHRLVCMAFHPIDNPDDMVVNHKDGNKQNNTAENLEWCTRSHNTKEAYKIGLMQDREYHKKPVVRIDSNGVEKVYSSMKSAIIELNGLEHYKNNKANRIYRACQKSGRMALGYRWRYLEE